VLLSLYGGVALLGYGLHELSAVDHHHHGHTAHAGPHHHHHDGPCSKHHHHQALADSLAWLGPVHDCPVCEFLDQVRSERPAVIAGVVWQHFVAAVSVTTPRFSAEPILGLHVPRGPPVLAG